MNITWRIRVFWRAIRLNCANHASWETALFLLPFYEIFSVRLGLEKGSSTGFGSRDTFPAETWSMLGRGFLMLSSRCTLRRFYDGNHVMPRSFCSDDTNLLLFISFPRSDWDFASFSVMHVCSDVRSKLWGARCFSFSVFNFNYLYTLLKLRLFLSVFCGPISSVHSDFGEFFWLS